jgi:hypothetical protein
LGTCRALFSWVALDATKYLGIGTNLKYYIADGGQYNDITPVRSTTGAGDVTFAATNGSSVITVTDAAHGANLNDFVTFSAAASLGGNVTAAILNAEHQVTAVTNNNIYSITVSVTANGSDTGNGGSSTVGAYQVNTGLDTNFFGTGWGAGVWNGVDTNEITTTLNEELDASETGVDVTSATGMSTSDVIDVGGELMLISGISSNTLTVTRAHGGTTAAVHSDGELVRLVLGNATAADDTVTLINDGSGLSATATTVTVDSAANFTSTGYIKINDEIIEYTGKTSTTFTGLIRGSLSTTAAAHVDNDAVIEAAFGWGMPAEGTVSGAVLTNWTHDNFGEDLLLNIKNGGIFYWDRTAGTSSRAVALSSLSGSNLARLLP